VKYLGVGKIVAIVESISVIEMSDVSSVLWTYQCNAQKEEFIHKLESLVGQD
jgi:hypothetical protein